MPDVPAGALPTAPSAAAPEFDVLVVGAGLSGVGAGCRLRFLLLMAAGLAQNCR